MATPTSPRLGVLVFTAFFTFCPVSESAVLFSSGDNITSGSTAFTHVGSAMAQNFTISQGTWSIDGFQILMSPIPSGSVGGLSVGIYRGGGEVRPTDLVLDLGNPNETGHLTPAAPLTLGSGSYWFIVERIGDFPDNIGWGAPAVPFSESPEALEAFSFGRAGRAIPSLSVDWTLVSEGGHFPIAIFGPIPEPGSIALMALGAVGLVMVRLRKSQR